MNHAVFDNTLSSLKDKGIFDLYQYEGKKYRKLKKLFNVKIEKEVNVIFSFNIDNANKRKD